MPSGWRECAGERWRSKRRRSSSRPRRLGSRASACADVGARRVWRSVEPVAGFAQGPSRSSGRILGCGRHAADWPALSFGWSDEPLQHHLRGVSSRCPPSCSRPGGHGRSPRSRSSRSRPCSSFTSLASTWVIRDTKVGFRPISTGCSSRWTLRSRSDHLFREPALRSSYAAANARSPKPKSARTDGASSPRSRRWRPAPPMSSERPSERSPSPPRKWNVKRDGCPVRRGIGRRC